MSYEINVSLNGQHLFATAERSLTSERAFLDASARIRAAFPESAGYKVSAILWSRIGTPIDMETGRTRDSGIECDRLSIDGAERAITARIDRALREAGYIATNVHNVDGMPSAADYNDGLVALIAGAEGTTLEIEVRSARTNEVAGFISVVQGNGVDYIIDYSERFTALFEPVNQWIDDEVLPLM